VEVLAKGMFERVRAGLVVREPGREGVLLKDVVDADPAHLLALGIREQVCALWSQRKPFGNSLASVQDLDGIGIDNLERFLAALQPRD
jgi:hypothetical protein